jgi:hypothetical protein
MCIGNHDFANELNATLATMPRTIAATKLASGVVIQLRFPDARDVPLTTAN